MCVSFLWVIIMDNDLKYMKLALKEAQKSLLSDDVPVGAVIVKNGVVISKAHNIKEKTKISTRHAEIIAIEKASKKLKSWYLNNCVLYVTMEPCLMCCGAIIQSRIETVVYATKNEKFGYVDSIDQIFQNKKNNHIVNVKNGVLNFESKSLLKDFFRNKRH